MPLHGCPGERRRNAQTASLNRQDKARACAAMIRHGLIPAKPLRVLVSEGSSTSAREAITILGLVGPSRRGLRSLALVPCAVLAIRPEISPLSRAAGRSGRISRLRRAAAGHRHFDVLLPTHEQGFLFARVRQRLAGRVGLALPGFESYRTAHSKAGFSRLLDRLGSAAAADADRDIAQMNCATPSGFLPSSRPRSAPPAAASGSCAMPAISNIALRDLERKRRIRRRGAGAGSHRRHDREGAIGVLPRPD